MEQKQQQQNIKAGLDACWQQYCALRQGVLEAANATGYPISKISQLDMKLEQSLLTPDRVSANHGNAPPRLTGGKRGRDSEVETDALMNNQGIEPLMTVAEAFSDELQTLRANEHFKGSARDVEVMASMMRCLARGMDDTERLLLLENLRTANNGPWKGSDTRNTPTVVPPGP